MEPHTSSDEPPKCECNLYAFSKVVKKPGPSCGERFWTCPTGKDRGGCGFFQWENPAMIQKSRAQFKPKPPPPIGSPQKRAREDDSIGTTTTTTSSTNYMNPGTTALTNSGLLQLTTISLSAEETAALPLLLSIVHKLMGQNQ